LQQIQFFVLQRRGGTCDDSLLRLLAAAPLQSKR
jgi:hypothetical protein